MVVVAAVVDVFEDGGDEIAAVVGKQSEQGVMAFLQMAVRSEAMGDVSRLASGLFVLAQHLEDDLGAALGELIADLLARGFECLGEGGIEVVELGFEGGEGLVHVTLGSLNSRCEVWGDQTLGQGLADVFFALKHVGITDTEAFDGFGGFRIDDGKEGPWEDEGHAVEQSLVEHFGLGEVCQFAGASDEGGSGKEPILPDRSKQRIGRKSGTVGGHDFRLISDFVELELLAFAVFEEEEEGCIVALEVDLGVVTGGAEFAVAGEHGSGEFWSTAGGFCKERGASGAELRVERIGKEEAERRKEFLEQAEETFAKGFPILVVAFGKSGDFVIERELVWQPGKSMKTGGAAIGIGCCRDVGIPERGAADLFDIVVFGSKPEDGNGRFASGIELFCQLDCAKRLVQRVGGAAIEADLLAGEDGYGVGLGEEVERGAVAIDGAEGF